MLAVVGSRDPLVGVAAAWEHLTTGPFALRVVEAGRFYEGAAQRQVQDLVTVAQLR